MKFFSPSGQYNTIILRWWWPKNKYLILHLLHVWIFYFSQGNEESTKSKEVAIPIFSAWSLYLYYFCYTSFRLFKSVYNEILRQGTTFQWNWAPCCYFVNLKTKSRCRLCRRRCFIIKSVISTATATFEKKE